MSYLIIKHLSLVGLWLGEQVQAHLVVQLCVQHYLYTDHLCAAHCRLTSHCFYAPLRFSMCHSRSKLVFRLIMDRPSFLYCQRLLNIIIIILISVLDNGCDVRTYRLIYECPVLVCFYTVLNTWICACDQSTTAMQWGYSHFHCTSYMATYLLVVTTIYYVYSTCIHLDKSISDVWENIMHTLTSGQISWSLSTV